MPGTLWDQTQFEREMATGLGTFQETINASVRRSDQSFLGMAFSLNAALNPGATVPTQNPAVEFIDDPSDAVDRSDPGRLPWGQFESTQRKKLDAVSLEPTIVLEQKARYLNLLNELRRINEGDDTSDSPGYSLNLVRLPISILPGRRTRKGYGAEITVTAETHLSDELLPITFRNLVINDVVDQLALVITRVLDDPKLLEQIEAALVEVHRIEAPFRSDSTPVDRESEAVEKEYTRPFAERIPGTFSNYVSISMPYVSFSRRSSLAFPPSQLADVMGEWHVIAHVIQRANQTLRGRTTLYRANLPDRVHLPDVEAFLREEVQSAYDFLSTDLALVLWQAHCTPKLVAAIRERRRYLPEDEFQRLQHYGGEDAQSRNAWSRDHIVKLRRDFFNDIKRLFPRASHTATASLAWAIIVDAALLNAQLTGDMRETAIAKNCGCAASGSEGTEYCLPNPSPLARETFNEYVRCRWPIHTFALDPIRDDQNVADVFSLRREMQLAAAVALAGGQINPNAAFRFLRRLEMDIEVIALHRKAIGFSHGHDTFGWRFYPRVQTPPTATGLRAFHETLFGGPTRDQLLNQRQLEPGMRECTAIVLMPSFVPYVRLDSRANWFQLTDPSHKEMALHDTVKISRMHYKVRQTLAAQCIGLQGSTDLAYLHRASDQIQRKLPIQNMMVPVPYENTLGGFEMFSSGVTDLAPTLRGWYGAPGVVVDADRYKCRTGGVALRGADGRVCAGTCDGTTLFLVGDSFSVHDTRVIAGGRCVPFVLMSRQILRATIPYDINALSHDGRNYVDVHAATPYGVTNHLLIPVKNPLPQDEIQAGLKQLEDVLTKHSFEVTRPAKLVVFFDFHPDHTGLTRLEMTPASQARSFRIKYRGYEPRVDRQLKLPAMVRIGAALRQKDGQFVKGITLLEAGAAFPFKRGRAEFSSPAILNALQEALSVIDASTLDPNVPYELDVVLYVAFESDGFVPPRPKWTTRSPSSYDSARPSYEKRATRV